MSNINCKHELRVGTTRQAGRVLLRILCGAASITAGSIAHAQQTMPGDLVLSRYTTASALPDASEDNPLAAIVRIQFPRAEVKTVGGAIRYTLIRTGYVLREPEPNSAVAAVMTRSLPESQRTLGTYSVESVLKVLMGKPFILHADALNRTVSYASPPALPTARANVEPQKRTTP